MKIQINHIEDYSAIFEICRDKDVSFKNIELDFRKTKFICPHDILLTVQTAIYIHKFNPSAKISLITEAESKTKKYIDDVGVIDFCNKNHIQSQTIEFIKSQTAMPIRRIDQAHIEEYTLRTLHYLSQFCHKKDLTILSVGIKEAINNVHDHSQSEIGAYIFCQYFPKTNEINVCVSDMGIGIPANVKKYLSDDDYSDKECIKWAIGQNNTTKSTPQNAGRGLTNIVDFVRANKGFLQVISGDGKYVLRDEKEIFTKNTIDNFIGTLIEFNIIVDNLENEEEIITQYF